MITLNILIVDDEKGSRDLISHCLENLGHHTESAEDADAAIAKITTRRYDAIITDKRMPDHGEEDEAAGLHVLKFAAENSPESQVIITTGYPDIEDAVNAMQKGAFDYLVKPFPLPRLEAIIQRLITFKSFLDPRGMIESYRSLRQEMLRGLKSSTLSSEEGQNLLVSVAEKIDEIFQARKRLENIIFDQRDSMAQIAMYTAMLNEELGEAPPRAAELLQQIALIADRRL